MNRRLCCALALLISGCMLPPERAPVRPLAEDSPPLPYAELLTRARLQAASATESFYVDRWGDLEETARGLEQTARFLNKAVEVPESQKKSLPEKAKALQIEAAKLREAAKEKNVEAANTSLQKINLCIRTLRLTD
ncbi:MAG: hypothetical protein KatS3mg105_2692 [Gemmatales bacterium]|nr:MAG: hypothetical protein KatS3mg105_2692 [Gemmatales bacterium]